MQTTTKLSTKGQIIVPKAVRDARGWKAGTEFTILETKDGLLLKPLPLFPRTRFEDAFGALQYHGRPKTLEEMDQAITEGVRQRRARGRY